MTERTIAELEDELTQGAARIDAALCSWLLTLAEFDRRAGYEAWECRSAAHFLNWRCGISMRTAREHVKVARKLEAFPVVRAKFADGVLSYSKVRAIARIVTPETEATLVEWAECATAAQLDKVVKGRASLDKKDPAQRYVTWSYEDDGTFVLRAKLLPEEGALVVAALQSGRGALRDEVENGPAGPVPAGGSAELSRPGNAEALMVMAETTLAHGPTPVVAGDRHMVLVHLNAETGEAQLDGGPVLSEESKQFMLCGASIAATVTGEDREVLYMGRLMRLPNRAQRRALGIRDGGCVFPGCTQRIWVDAHHLEEWENGGLTDIDNLVLLCRFHHTAVHHRGFRIVKGPHQTFRFYDPNGIELVAAPPLAKPTGEIPRHGASGRPISPDAPIPNWDGHHPDYATAVEGLCWLEENAHVPERVAS